MIFKDGEIILDRELSELDIFAIDFIRILEQHSSYVIVSGYVSILLGRSRASEDIDVLAPALEKGPFEELIVDLKDYECLNTDSQAEMMDLLKDKIGLRFAKKGTIIPNIELKWVKNPVEALALKDAVRVKLPDAELRISPIELQIAFKENVLKSPKDMEDARHLRQVCPVDNSLITKYKRMLHEFF